MMKRMSLLAIVAGLGLAACSTADMRRSSLSDTRPQYSGYCEYIGGTTFISYEKFPGSRGSEELRSERVRFTGFGGNINGGTFEWTTGDLVLRGDYSCQANGDLTAVTSDGRRVQGSFDFESMVLTWNELAFVEYHGEPVDICRFIRNTGYISILKYESGLGPDGPVMAHWGVGFADDKFNEIQSDFARRGTYTCDHNRGENAVEAALNDGTPVSVRFDVDTMVLYWEGRPYTRPTQPDTGGGQEHGNG